MSINALHELLAPVGTEVFIEQHLTRSAPLFVKAEHPHKHDWFFTPSELDELLSAIIDNRTDLAFLSPSENEFDRKQLVDEQGRVRLNKLLECYSMNGTALFHDTQRKLPRVARMCRSLQRTLGMKVAVHFYLTRRPQQATHLHYGRTDVLIAQVFGSKRWRIYRSEGVPFIYSQAGEYMPDDDLDEPVIDVALEPGDLIYVPAGFPHSVEAISKDVGHFTISLEAVRWRDVLFRAVSQLDGLETELGRSVPRELLRDPLRRSELAQRLADVASRALHEVDIGLVTQQLIGGEYDNVGYENDGHFFNSILTDVEITADFGCWGPPSALLAPYSRRPGRDNTSPDNLRSSRTRGGMMTSRRATISDRGYSRRLRSSHESTRARRRSSCRIANRHRALR